ncbi:hypothetical protein [Curtobacterium ammoniigenes]|uniref:hypothetical protein n=1 Tax=Curtobacterium ammoniigenes TaxID=395387 RepID=UPI0012ECEEF5|nr:hypothetical protein [Curtobacterium ammoniigenes]
MPGGQGALLDLFVAAMLGIGSVLGAAAGIGALSRAADDDRAGRSELLLAAPVSRVRQFGEWLALGLVAAALVDLVAGAVGAACFAAGGQPRFWSTIEAGAAQIPASVAVVAVAALLSAVLPRASGWLSWTILVTAVVLGQFGGVLQIPEWARQVSPFSHTPGVPAAHVDWSGAWWLVAVTIAVGMVALVLARRQDTAR